jgi:hypothetical protein
MDRLVADLLLLTGGFLLGAGSACVATWLYWRRTESRELTHLRAAYHTMRLDFDAYVRLHPPGNPSTGDLPGRGA